MSCIVLFKAVLIAAFFSDPPPFSFPDATLPPEPFSSLPEFPLLGGSLLSFVQKRDDPKDHPFMWWTIRDSNPGPID